MNLYFDVLKYEKQQLLPHHDSAYVHVPPRNRSFLGMSKEKHIATFLSVLFGSTAASLFAGGIGSAIGVGIAFPIDVLKTKMQVKVSIKGTADETLFMRAIKTFREEGVAGFFRGVTAAMMGNALISAVSFSANELAIGALNGSNFLGGGVGGRATTPFLTLLLAACFAGIIQTFVVVPVGKFISFELISVESFQEESMTLAKNGILKSAFSPKNAKDRVKVMMQAQEKGALSQYANELECIKSIVQNEGWFGLLTRGLNLTLAREVPSNAIYFVVYGLLMQTAMKDALGVMASMVCGAISGIACWIPVYPIDVVKTRMQNTKGGKSDNATNDGAGGRRSSLHVATAMYTTEGIGAFFKGLGPLLLRAAVSNGVTFFVYDLIMASLDYT
jgi:hypothetical protein